MLTSNSNTGNAYDRKYITATSDLVSNKIEPSSAGRCNRFAHIHGKSESVRPVKDFSYPTTEIKMCQDSQ